MPARPLVLAATLLLATTAAAAAGPARCTTSDDGTYPCDFEQFGGDGSFTVTAKGKPTFTLNVTGPDQGEVTMNLGGNATGLPGPYMRDKDDRACWVSDDTGARLCVR